MEKKENKRERKLKEGEKEECLKRKSEGGEGNISGDKEERK